MRAPGEDFNGPTLEESIAGSALHMIRTIENALSEAFLNTPLDDHTINRARCALGAIVRDFKNRTDLLDRPEFDVDVERCRDSLLLVLTPALRDIMLTAERHKAERCAASDAKYKAKRAADPFWIWMDSMPDDENGIIWSIRNGCDGESGVARFVFEALGGAPKPPTDPTL